MNNDTLLKKIDDLEKEIAEKNTVLKALRKDFELETVRNYIFHDINENEISLTDLFNDKDTLIMIHNMGKNCSSCTMWADGFSGVYRHVSNQTSFALSSPDTPEVQKRLKAERGWTFPMVSTSNDGNTFTSDVGFKKDSLVYPGLSVFVKNENGIITHEARRIFGPGDNFGVLWHLLDLIPKENKLREEKRTYSSLKG